MNSRRKRLVRSTLVIPMGAVLLLASGCADEGADEGFGEAEFRELETRIGDLEEEDELFDERVTRLEEEAGF